MILKNYKLNKSTTYRTKLFKIFLCELKPKSIMNLHYISFKYPWK